MTETNLSCGERSRAFALALLITALCTLVALAVMLFHNYEEQQDDAEDFLALVELVIQSGYKNLELIDVVPYHQCSPEHLSALRKILFSQTYIRDIVHFSEGQPDCSVILGQLDQASVERPTYIVTPNDLTISHKLYSGWYGPELEGYAHGNGHYDLVYSDNFVEAFVPEDHAYQVVYSAAGETKHMVGQPSLYTGQINSATDWRLGSGLHSEACSETSPICIATHISLKAWLEKSNEDFAILVLLTMAVAWLVYRKQCRLTLKRRSINARIKKGLHCNRFFPQFQPIVSMNNRDVIGCEILARFKDEYGPIYPDQFIPVIQEMNRTWEFSQLMLERSLHELDRQTTLPEGFRVSFNLYPSDVSSGAIATLRELNTLKETRFSLVFEIIEDQFLEQEGAQEHLKKLAEDGHMVAIDDFGKGYSNLQQIQKINCQILKIDRSFTVELEEGSIRSSLIPNIIKIARKAKLKLVAEGIENERQHRLLKEWGVEYGQGWLYGKPMSATSLAKVRTQENNDQL